MDDLVAPIYSPDSSQPMVWNSSFQTRQRDTEAAASGEAVMKTTLDSTRLLRFQKEILVMIATDEKLQTTLQAILHGLEQFIPGVQGAIYPHTPETHSPQQAMEYPSANVQMSPPTQSDGSRVTGLLRARLTPIMVTTCELADVVAPARHPSSLERCVNIWSMALQNSQGQSIGVFRLYAHCERSVQPTEQALLDVAVDLIGIAIERRCARTATQWTEAKYQDVFEHLNIGVFQTTPAGQYVNVNAALAKLYGYSSPAELIATLTNIGEQLYIDPCRRVEFVSRLKREGVVSNFESQIRRRDGKVIWISEHTRSVCDAHGQVLYYEGLVKDVTTRRLAEEQLIHGALHDSLTQLPNRACFLNRVQEAIASTEQYAVLFLDLDRFKVINDSLGHLVGDQLLQAVSQRLLNHLPSHHVLGRIGGDEFALLLTSIAQLEDAIALTKQLLVKIQQPFQIQNYEVFVEASVGIAWGSSVYKSAEAILRDADLAMYDAKNTHAQYRYQVFDPPMQVRAHQRLQLENDLRHSIERDELYLVYQPLVNLETGRLKGFEALLRWQHPEQGAIAPNVFIPVAEETGQIHRIGAWLLEQACQQLQQWQGSDIYLNVNLSMLQVKEIEFVQRLQQTCEAYNIAAQTLKLELTESSLLGGEAIHRRHLHALKEMGFSLCVDDFGTGYSSLSRLHTLPIDTLKIDRTFIEDLDQPTSHSLPFIKTMVALAQSLQLELVAEGVETLAQAQILKSLGCHTGQGYLWAKPLDVETASHWVAHPSRAQYFVPEL